jgi:hypothetical protein
MPADSSGALRRVLRLANTIALCILLMACAAEVTRHPTAITPMDSVVSGDQRRIAKNVLVTFDTGYERALRKDTMWKPVGNVPQGTVYASVDSVFSVEGAHVHEAYLVVSRGNLVGFYLPVERSFVSLDPARVVNLWGEQ